MNEAQAAIARRAARTLATDFDTNLPALIERVLAERERDRGAGPSDHEPQRYDAGLSIAAAALVVSAASLAWTIYRDLKKDAQQNAQQQVQTVLRRLRVQFTDVDYITTAQRDRILEAVVEETVEMTSDLPPGP